MEVRDIGILESKIFRNYYNTNKYETFVRQLNKYGFTRIKPEVVGTSRASGVRDIFKHKFFQKGKSDLLSKIEKKQIQGGGKGNKNFRCREEVQALQVKLASLEEGQVAMQQSIRQIQGGIHQETSIGADTLERMENRLKYVEEFVFTLMNQRRPRRHSNGWPGEPSSDIASALPHPDIFQFPEAPRFASTNESLPAADLGSDQVPEPFHISHPHPSSTTIIRDTADDSAVGWIRGIDLDIMKED